MYSTLYYLYSLFTVLIVNCSHPVNWGNCYPVITDLILDPNSEYIKVQQAFKESYTPDKKRNVFTKVRMDIEADVALLKYFSNKSTEIQNWFNVITPKNKTILDLKTEIIELRSKQWSNIL